MTFSIVASNPSTKELCVATSTGLVAVGNLVPSILPNIGAICVQAMVKPSYRETILDLRMFRKEPKEVKFKIINRIVRKRASSYYSAV